MFWKQGRRKPFYSGGIEQKCPPPGLPEGKNLKKTETPQKMKFRPKYKSFKISYVELYFWKCYFGHTTSLYLSRPSCGHHQSLFLISDSLAESLRDNKNLQKRPHILQYSFAQETSLVLQTLTHLTLKIICSRK